MTITMCHVFVVFIIHYADYGSAMETFVGPVTVSKGQKYKAALVAELPRYLEYW